MSNIVQLGDGLRRLTAPNPGPMTGAGTNTYLLGRERFVLVDPGPAIDSHIDALYEAVAGRLDAILVTHTHHDHSPAASILASRSGAQVYGMLSGHSALQDPTCIPDCTLVDKQLLDFGDACLRALHTPGHVDNHFCFLHEESGVLLAGDHIMQGSTVVIVPPQGDMAAYINSLRDLSLQSLRTIAPAHGEMMPQPQRVIAELIAHRLRRERKVMQKLAAFDQLDFVTLLQAVYDDVDPRLHVIARYSLLAHLLKLSAENKVVHCARAAQAGAWSGESIDESSGELSGALRNELSGANAQDIWRATRTARDASGDK